jgi:hypothetical protein
MQPEVHPPKPSITLLLVTLGVLSPGKASAACPHLCVWRFF